MFNNFILVQSDRMPFEQLVRLIESGDLSLAEGIIRRVYQENHRLAERTIFESTKKGDTILIQSSQRMEPREWFEVAQIPYSDNMRRLWYRALGQMVNMYADLAMEAGANDRIIISPDSSRTKEWWKTSLRSTKRRDQEWNEYRYRFGRSKTVSRMIANQKPALVIVASPHAAYVEEVFHPKKVVWSMPAAHEQMREILEHRREVERQLVERLARLREARDRLRERKRRKKV